MLSRLETVVDLLHAAAEAALATHSVAVPGYPFATAVPFVTDAQHRPVLLISRLAEHTQNLAADPRASIMVSRQLGGGEMARVTLVGEVVPIAADPLLTARYLRFHPAAELFLQLGDFGFHRFEPQRIRIVGGFGQAGWLDAQRLLEAAHIGLDEEQRLIDIAASRLPPTVALLGVDCYGADLLVGDSRQRRSFDAGPVPAAELGTALTGVLTDIAREKES